MRCKEKHGDRYSYTFPKQFNGKTKIRIACKLHGNFLQSMYGHVTYGYGCPKCGYESNGKKFKKSTEDWISEFNRVHKSRYDYSKQKENFLAQDYIKIECPDHGVFEQQAYNHLAGHGCPECKYEAQGNLQTIPKDEWLKRFNDIHGDSYSYRFPKNMQGNKKVKVRCSKHGWFIQSRESHAYGRGCPKCSNGKPSVVENSVATFIEELGFELTRNKRFIKSDVTGRKQEIDIYVPEKKLAIEVCGLYWHSTLNGKRHRKYHQDKMTKCKELDIKLLTIWDREWIDDDSRSITKSRIRNALGCNEMIVYARKCKIVKVGNKLTSKFLTKHHSQHDCKSSVRYGLVHSNKLVAVMTFSKARYTKDHEWEMIRFATKSNMSVVGGASKLFVHFIKRFNPESVVSYCNLRWGNGNLYSQLGFELVKIGLPTPWYTLDYINLIHRSTLMKHKLDRLLDNFDPNLTQDENLFQNGYDQVYDCGQSTYRWTK